MLILKVLTINFFFLEHLDLNRNDFSQVIDWVQTVNKFSLLKVLLLNNYYLSNNCLFSRSLIIFSKSLVVTLSLTTILLQLSIGCPNFSNNFVYLDLGYNWDINSENLNEFFYLSFLVLT